MADQRPCRGANSNICVAEGCYGEACINPTAAPEAAPEAVEPAVDVTTSGGRDG